MYHTEKHQVVEAIASSNKQNQLPQATQLITKRSIY